MLLAKIGTEKFRQRLALVVFEAALVVLGVLLGLLANEWRLARDHLQEAEVALDGIHQELQRNAGEVEAVLPAHRRMRDSLDVLVTRIMQQQDVRISFTDVRQAMPEGFVTPIVQTDAWELAGRLGVPSRVDYDLVADLSRTYQLQAFYQGKLDRAADNLYVAGNVDPDDFRAWVLSMFILVNDVIIQEENIVVRYAEAIERLDARAP